MRQANGGHAESRSVHKLQSCGFTVVVIQEAANSFALRIWDRCYRKPIE